MPACVRCGQDNPEIARFCLACGAPLAAGEPRQERKVVTVLFADLVGFTSRAERLDPEDVRAMLGPYHARLKRELEHYGGTVEKFVGDAVMALFGAPVAHEDDPERAVRAALAIQAAVESLSEQEPGHDLQVRIGVTTGEALVTLDARPSEGEGMAAGDVVNTAARLQAAAPVNGILVDETTRRATADSIEYHPHEPVSAKGKTGPVPVWQAIAARASVGVDVVRDTRTPLVGRDRELGALADALARSRAERTPQLVTLIGVPGIGKSRLVWELYRLADADAELITWRQGRCLPYGEGVAFSALAEMVKAQAGLLETDTATGAEEKLEAMLAVLLPAAGERGWVAAHVRPLVGLPGERGGGQTEVFAAWRRLLEALAEQRPLVLVFEDLQWGDDPLLDFVDHLVDWATGVPLLVVCTARPELLDRRPAWGGGKLNAATLALAPLPPADAARLVSALLEQPALPASLQGTLLERAEGNPLYAEQYVRMLTDRGLLARDGGGWRLAPAEELPLPENVQGIISARLDGLRADEKSLLQDAAVVGKVFWLGALAAVAGRQPQELAQPLHRLERTGFVRRQRRASVADELEYAFEHSLVRDVAYGQIPRLERASRHRRAATWVEALGVERSDDRAQIAAHHYLQALELVRAAGRDDPELAARTRATLVEAGEHAGRLGAREAAAELFSRALALTPLDDPGRARLLYLRGKAIPLADASTDADLAEAVEALLRAGEVEAAADAEIARSGYYWNRGEVEESKRHLRRALELVEGRPPTPLKAEVVGMVALREMLLDNLEDAAVLARRELTLADGLGLPRLRADALITAGTIAALDSGGRDSASLEQGLELARELNDAYLVVRGAKNLASVLVDGGRLTQAEALTREALRDATQFGDGYNAGWFEVELMGYAFHRGDWDEVERLGRAFLEALHGKRHYMEHACHAYLGRVAAERGRIAEGLASSGRGLELARGTTELQALLPALASYASVLLLAGRAGEAGSVVDEFAGLSRSRPTHAVGDVAFALVALGRESVLPPGPDGAWQAAALEVVGHRFAAAADAFAEIGSRLHEAQARMCLAAGLSAVGERDDAAREAAAAADFYRRAGARARLDESEALLRAS